MSRLLILGRASASQTSTQSYPKQPQSTCLQKHCKSWRKNQHLKRNWPTSSTPGPSIFGPSVFYCWSLCLGFRCIWLIRVAYPAKSGTILQNKLKKRTIRKFKRGCWHRPRETIRRSSSWSTKTCPTAPKASKSSSISKMTNCVLGNWIRISSLLTSSDKW